MVTNNEINITYHYAKGKIIAKTDCFKEVNIRIKQNHIIGRQRYKYK